MKGKSFSKLGMGLLVVFVLTLCCFMPSVLAASITLDPIYPTDDGFTATVKGTTSWYNNTSLSARTAEDRVIYLKFVVPEFDGTIDSAILKLTASETLTLDSNQMITVHRVLDNNWDETNIKPIYQSLEYIPHMDSEALASYTFTSTAFTKDTTIVNIDVKNIIKQPGTYSIAIRNDSGKIVRFYSREGETINSRKPQLNITVDSSQARGEINTVVTDKIIPSEDGHYNNYADPKAFENFSTLYAMADSRGVAEKAIYLKFNIPNYVKNIKTVRLNLKVSSNNSQNNIKVYAYGIQDTSWNETTSAPTGINNPSMYLQSQLDRIEVNQPTAGTILTFDVSSLIKASGIYSVGILTSSTVDLRFHSSEAELYADRANIEVDFDIDAAASQPASFEVLKNDYSNDWRGTNSILTFNGTENNLYRVAKMSNNSASTITVSLVQAQYSDTQLVDIGITNVTIPANWYHNAFENVTYSSEITSIRSFIWNDMQNIKPLSQSASLAKDF